METLNKTEYAAVLLKRVKFETDFAASSIVKRLLYATKAKRIVSVTVIKLIITAFRIVIGASCCVRLPLAQAGSSIDSGY